MIALALSAIALALATLPQGAPTSADADAGISVAQEPSGTLADSVSPSPISASAGAAPDTVTVGDHFRAVVRVMAPAGSTVEFPDFNILEPVEAIDSVRVARDSAGAWTATYRLVAWTTGDSMVAAISFRVRSATEEVQDLRVRLPLPVVRSVLPADSSLHVPRPAKAVIPLAMPGETVRGWLLPTVLLFAAALAGVAWLVLRRGRGTVVARSDPRAAALAELAAIEKARLPERGEIREYHVRTSRVLRAYLAAEAGWGEDLTSTELLGRMRGARLDDELARVLERLLRHADRVKFSETGQEPGMPSPPEFGAGVRAWIVAWPPSAALARQAEAA